MKKKCDKLSGSFCKYALEKQNSSIEEFAILDYIY
jgi:hypothetical protein